MLTPFCAPVCVPVSRGLSQALVLVSAVYFICPTLNLGLESWGFASAVVPPIEEMPEDDEEEEYPGEEENTSI